MPFIAFRNRASWDLRVIPGRGLKATLPQQAESLRYRMGLSCRETYCTISFQLVVPGGFLSPGEKPIERGSCTLWIWNITDLQDQASEAPINLGQRATDWLPTRFEREPELYIQSQLRGHKQKALFQTKWVMKSLLSETGLAGICVWFRVEG